MLDDRNTNPDPELVPLAAWSYDDNVTGWDALLGPRQSDTLDIFRDEDVGYALTLSRAGVPVELHLHPGVPDEYDAIAFGADVSHRALADRHRVLKAL